MRQVVFLHPPRAQARQTWAGYSLNTAATEERPSQLIRNFEPIPPKTRREERRLPNRRLTTGTEGGLASGETGPRVRNPALSIRELTVCHCLRTRAGPCGPASQPPEAHARSVAVAVYERRASVLASVSAHTCPNRCELVQAGARLRFANLLPPRGPSGQPQDQAVLGPSEPCLRAGHTVTPRSTRGWQEREKSEGSVGLRIHTEEPEDMRTEIYKNRNPCAGYVIKPTM